MVLWARFAWTVGLPVGLGQYSLVVLGWGILLGLIWCERWFTVLVGCWFLGVVYFVGVVDLIAGWFGFGFGLLVGLGLMMHLCFSGLWFVDGVGGFWVGGCLVFWWLCWVLRWLPLLGFMVCMDFDFAWVVWF